MATRTPRRATPGGRVRTRTLERRIGDLIGERYQLHALLGAGRQGAVYRAHDLKSGGDVAVKLLHAVSDPTLADRLEREAEALERLGSDGVVRLIGRAWDKDRIFCMVTEVLDGEPLESLLARLERTRERMSRDELLRIVQSVTGTLDRAHALGMIHRDVKPSNIFLTSRGAVKLIDFGYVKVTGAGSVTAIDVVPGTPAYVAPEVARTETLDGRADLYGLGVVIFRVLTGTLPFDGNHPVAIIDKALHAERPSIYALRPDLAPEIDAFSERAIAANPRDRFESGASLYEALHFTLNLTPAED